MMENDQKLVKKSCTLCRRTCCVLLCAIVGIFFIIGGSISVPVFDTFYQNQINNNLILKNGSAAYNGWSGITTNLPLYNKMYVFNYTNVEEVLKNGSKPIVKQLGPYSYRELRINYVLDANNDNITYALNYTYFFDQETSCPTCFENDTIFTPSLPIVVILQKLRELNVTSDSSFFKRSAMQLLNQFLIAEDVSLFGKLTVQQLLWGYDDPLMELFKKMETILAIFQFKIPKINPIIMMQRNASIEAEQIGNITISTGIEDINNIQQILAWKGKSDISAWRTKYGNMINGSDGTHAKPNFKRDDIFYMFLVDACRSIFLSYDSDVSLFGLNLYRYMTTEEVFADAKSNPNNEAFCDPQRCWPSGLMPVGPCADGDAPIFMSAPHFYQGDRKLVNAITGLHPEKDLHGLYVDIEHITGLALGASIQFQLNFMATKTEYITMTDNLLNDENFFPVMYFHNKAAIDKDTVEQLKFGVITIKLILKVVEYSIISIGSFIAIIAFFVEATRRRYKEPEFKQLAD